MKAFGLLLSLMTVVTAVSIAHAGPVGRDLDRELEAHAAQAERPVEPSDVTFEVRTAHSYSEGGVKSVCYKLVAIERSSGQEQELRSCLTGERGEINYLIQGYQRDLQAAKSEGRRIIFRPGHEFDEADSRRDRREEERAERFR